MNPTEPGFTADELRNHAVICGRNGRDIHHRGDPMRNDREALAQVINAADNRWQHGIGSSGTSWDGYVADAILASPWLADVFGSVWDKGHSAGEDDEYAQRERTYLEPESEATTNPYTTPTDGPRLEDACQPCRDKAERDATQATTTKEQLA